MDGYIVFMLIIIVLVTVLVVRVSEISTSIKALEKCVVYCISREECKEIIEDRMGDTVTHDTLKSLLRITRQ